MFLMERRPRGAVLLWRGKQSCDGVDERTVLTLDLCLAGIQLTAEGRSAEFCAV